MSSAVRAAKVDWMAMKRLLVFTMVAMRRIRAEHTGARTPRGARHAPGEYAAGLRVRHRSKAWTRWNWTWPSPRTTSWWCRTTRYWKAPVCTGPAAKAVIRELTLAAGPRVGLRRETESGISQATSRCRERRCRRWTRSSRWRRRESSCSTSKPRSFRRSRN